jgi:hypothetical protein
LITIRNISVGDFPQLVLKSWVISAGDGRLVLLLKRCHAVFRSVSEDIHLDFEINISIN